MTNVLKKIDLFRIKRRILSSQVQKYPYPFLDIENIFTKLTLNSLNENWPNSDFFSDYNISGLRTFQLNYETLNGLCKKKQLFWRSFFQDYLQNILKIVAGKFLDYYLFKHKGEIPYLGLGGAMLMEISAEKIKYPKKGYYWMYQHTHFFHDPLWYATLLMPISDDGSIGTTLYHTKNYKTFYDPLKFYSDCMDHDIPGPINVMDYDGNPEGKIKKIYKKKVDFNNKVFVPFKNINFKPGKLFSFLDSPISVHGVEQHKVNLKYKNTRRVLRFHLMNNPSDKEYFGESLEVLRKKLDISSPNAMKKNKKFKQKILRKELKSLQDYYHNSSKHFSYKDALKYIKCLDLNPFGGMLK